MSLAQAVSIAALVSVPVAIASVVVALLARRDAKRSAQAAERSAQSAEQLTTIEQRRLHAGLTPRLTVKAACLGLGSDQVNVTVRLDGPDGLDHLDQVAVRVRDDHNHSPVTAGDPTQEQIDATIWGPYRFIPGVDGADQLGRTVRPFPLARGQSRPLAMQPSLQPAWVSSLEVWRHRYAEQPIQLDVTCAREGEPPWRIPVEINHPQPRFTVDKYPSDGMITLVARNVGTAPARRVDFRSPPNGPAVSMDDEVRVVEVGHSISASVVLFEEITATWIELTWSDHFGLPRQQRVELVGR